MDVATLEEMRRDDRDDRVRDAEAARARDALATMEEIHRRISHADGSRRFIAIQTKDTPRFIEIHRRPKRCAATTETRGSKRSADA